MSVALPAPVAALAFRTPACPNPVPHEVTKHAVLDQHIAPRRRTFVIHGLSPPLSPDSSVINERDEWAGYELIQSPSIDGRVLHNVVSLQPVSTCFMEHDPARASGEN